jgi:pyruvate/2-oxoglutarate dehydrogenase complex dihydrolipoamide dehydrogenase (E3) component
MTGVEKQGDSIVAKVESAGRLSQITGSHLLVATGRRPNTDDLGLDKAGVAMNARGYIEVDDQLHTNISGIWAMGDCNGRGAFTHTSWNDFEIVSANLLDNDRRRVSDRINAYALFTDPPLGRAGMTEAEVRKSGKRALISTLAMKDVMRAEERGETKGFMKVLVDRDSKLILGASYLGLEGDEVIHCVLDIMYAKAPYTVIQRAMHIHPTVSEFIPTMMDRLDRCNRPLRRSSACRTPKSTCSTPAILPWTKRTTTSRVLLLRSWPDILSRRAAGKKRARSRYDKPPQR